MEDAVDLVEGLVDLVEDVVDLVEDVVDLVEDVVDPAEQVVDTGLACNGGSGGLGIALVVGSYYDEYEDPNYHGGVDSGRGRINKSGAGSTSSY